MDVPIRIAKNDIGSADTTAPSKYRLRLLAEALKLLVRQAGTQYFYRCLSPQVYMLTQIDLRKAAFAKEVDSIG